MPKTAEKGAISGISRRTFVDDAEVLKRLEAAYEAATRRAGPRATGNNSFWSVINWSDEGRCRQVPRRDNGDTPNDQPAYCEFGGGGFQVDDLPAHNRASDGPLADPRPNRKLDAQVSANFIKTHAGPKPKRKREPSLWLRRCKIADRNAVLRNEEALGWIVEKENDPDLEEARRDTLAGFARGPYRAFAASIGLDRDKLRRTIDKYCLALARRINAAGGAIRPAFVTYPNTRRRRMPAGARAAAPAASLPAQRSRRPKGPRPPLGCSRLPLPGPSQA